MTDYLDLIVERAVPGGRMLARSDGRVVLVAGAIPGERVRVAVERVAAHVAFARVVDVLEPSPDRREVPGDSMCGGRVYAHVAPARQVTLKADVIADAFARVARLPLVRPVVVRPSAEYGYRLRGRLHVRGDRLGFFLEHSHDLCDPSTTGQLRAETLASAQAVLTRLRSAGGACEAVVVAENVTGSECVVHLESQNDAPIRTQAFAQDLPTGVTGVTTWEEGHLVELGGAPRVGDTAAELCGGADAAPVAAEVRWERSARSFFQGNRFLVGALLTHVAEAAQGAVVADLYAGVGLFAVALAARGARVLAIEGDVSGYADLTRNAAPYAALETHRSAVEHAARRLRPGAFDCVVVDPPRAGLSREAADAVLALDAPRLVYVSCDPATLARDAALAASRGYVLTSVTAFDLFPNTAHVETVATFERHAAPEDAWTMSPSTRARSATVAEFEKRELSAQPREAAGPSAASRRHRGRATPPRRRPGKRR